MGNPATEPTSNESSDRELLSRFVLRAEQDAFSQLVKRHGPLVLGVCRRLLGSEQDAEDVFQATFLALARRANQRVWQKSIAGWLFKVAYRACLRTRAQRMSRRTSTLESEAMVEDNQFSVIASQEEQEILHAEVHALPCKYREPIVLCCLEGMSREEAARELDCSVIDVKNRLQRGRRELLLRLGMRGMVLSAAFASLEGTVVAAEAALTESLIAETTQAAVASCSSASCWPWLHPSHPSCSQVRGYAAQGVATATVVLIIGLILLSSAPLQDLPVRPELHVDAVSPVADGLTVTMISDVESMQRDIRMELARQREEVIRAALKRPLTLEFIRTPLSDAASFLSKQHNIPIRVDGWDPNNKALQPGHSLITYKDATVAMEDALREFLQPLQMTIIVHDGVLLITSMKKAAVLQRQRR